MAMVNGLLIPRDDAKITGADHLLGLRMPCDMDGIWISYPLANIYRKLWKDPPCLSSVNHLFLWAMASIAMLVYQRVMMASLCGRRGFALLATSTVVFYDVRRV